VRLVVTGLSGQVTTALQQSAPDTVEIAAIGRPALDLARPASIYPALAAADPDVILSAAAYTAVDKAESEPELAFAVNADGAGAVAEAARRLGVPLIHLSTDYVFDGAKPAPYVETDPTGPTGIYGASKLKGERAVAAAWDNHVIARTAWVYAPFGANFVRTMLRLAESRDSVRVVADQLGCPTYAPDIAAAVLTMAGRLVRDQDPALRGVFHLSGGGETCWADFSRAIFAGLAERGGKQVSVENIGTADYPTPARRPANSRLSCVKLAELYGIELPPWRDSLADCLDRLIVAD